MLILGDKKLPDDVRATVGPSQDACRNPLSPARVKHPGKGEVLFSQNSHIIWSKNSKDIYIPYWSIYLE